jgi:hypothetical protein
MRDGVLTSTCIWFVVFVVVFAVIDETLSKRSTCMRSSKSAFEDFKR